MALVFANRPVNIVNPPVWYGDTLSATSTELIIANEVNAAIYKGVGLQYLGGTIVGGTFTNFAQYDAAGLQIEISEFSISAPVASTLVNSNNIRDVLSLILGGNDRVVGSSWGDYLAGYNGNDVLYGQGGANYIDGGAGTDIALYDGSIAGYSLSNQGTHISVRSANGIDDALVSVERIGFEDGTLALDEVSAQAYRLYQAAFARTPDKGGLSYWVSSLDDGNSLSGMASGFLSSGEFQSLYGANPASHEFVALLYQNVLGRGPDQAGYDYWLGRMESGVTREAALVEFSESAENRANVQADIAAGIWLDAGVWV